VRKEYEFIESATQRVVCLEESDDHSLDKGEGEDDWEQVNWEPTAPRREHAAVVKGS
jgi:hypothetical protein